MKTMVPFANAKLAALKQFILDEVLANKQCFEVSDVKGDGTVFVRFRSVTEASASTLAQSFCEAFDAHDVQFTQPEDCKFRLPLCQFEPGVKVH